MNKYYFYFRSHDADYRFGVIHEDTPAEAFHKWWRQNEQRYPRRGVLKIYAKAEDFFEEKSPVYCG